MSVTLKLLDGDYVLLSNGTYQIVEDEEKCQQDIAESLQNNWDPEDPTWWNGSEIYAIERNPILAHEAGIGPEAFVYNMVDESMLRLMQLQDEDSECSARERILEIFSLNVHRLGNSSFLFILIVKNEAGEPLKERFVVRLLSEIPPGMSETLVGGLEGKADQGKTFL